MMKNFDYRKLVRASKKRFDDPNAAQMWWVRPREEIMNFVETRRAEDFGVVLGRVSDLAGWHALRSRVLVGDGNLQQGWPENVQCFNYKFWQLRIEVERERLLVLARRRVHAVADPTRTPFHLLGMAMTFRRWEEAMWIADTILNTRKNFNWYEGPLAHYLVKLYTYSNETNLADFKLGPYSDVITNWNDPDKLKGTIRQMCDYHVAQIKYMGDFENNPHDIFPSEILALYRVREKLGLETPWVHHPLLDTPFAQVPEKIAYEPDPLVVQAMELVTELLPEAVAKR